MIVSRAAERAEVEAFVREDPFYREGIAEYRIVGFEPTKCAPGFEGVR